MGLQIAFIWINTKKYSRKLIRARSRSGDTQNSFLKIYVICPIGWHLFDTAHLKLHVFPVLKICVKLNLEELFLNYVFCTIWDEVPKKINWDIERKKQA